MLPTYFQHTIPLGEDSLYSSQSAKSSFSGGSSEEWDTSTIPTPVSTPRRGSPIVLKHENSAFAVTTQTSSPDRYVPANDWRAMNTMAQSMVSLDLEPQQDLSTPQAMSGFIDSYPPYLANSIGQPYSSSHDLRMFTPALVHDLCSPVSPTTPDHYIDPSQTTLDPLGLQSTMHPVKSLPSDGNYDFQSSDWDNGFLFGDLSPESTRYQVPDYPQYKSEPSTPSRGPSSQQSFGQGPEIKPSVDSISVPVSELESNEGKGTRVARKRSSKATTASRSYGKIRKLVNPKAEFQCGWPGCPKMFAKAEHRKRHYVTHRGEKSPCECCEKPFLNNRRDNYRTHLKLHADPPKGSRTAYHPGAAAALKRLDNETRKCAGPKARREAKVSYRVARTRS